MNKDYSVVKGLYVTLRLLGPKDASMTLKWRSSNRARFLNRGAISVEDQKKWIESRPSSEFNYIIEIDGGVPVGTISLIGIDPVNKHAEPSRFLIGEPESVKGLPIAVESISLIYKLAFDDLGLRRVYGTIAETNTLMIKWQKYLGLKEEGRLRDHYFINGEWQDAVCLGMLEDEYRSVCVQRVQALLSMQQKVASI